MEGLLAILSSYILGSISFGYLAGKLVTGIDIREYGSTSTGTTNTLRIIGVIPAIIVMILDIAKGIIAVLIAQLVANHGMYVLLSGLAVVAGHNWPLFLRFRGGRGSATIVGVLIALVPKISVIVMLVGISITVLTRYVSLGSIIAALLLPILMLIYSMPSEHVVFGSALGILLIYQHRSNIRRLLSGTENRIGTSKRRE